MRVLAIDTTLGACSACVADRGAAEALSCEIMPMERGHAEALAPLLERVIARAPGGFGAIDRVAVTVGPGSFTGLRIGIAAARAIGLALKVPVVGVTSLSALLGPVVATAGDRVAVAAIDARHGQVFVQAVAPGGRVVVPARLASVRDAARLLGSGNLVISGSGAGLLASEAWSVGVNAVVAENSLYPDPLWVARLGAVADPATALPKPYYLRAPDAKPQDGALALR
ncbi:tRNA (adenosine(37)-N6)-threonylcarbamoyltransferase complex dimerization subunit type 1 TsaB [Camelimonas abortus]|uniref:tRNA (Adenosine(37)-N6)-threonylcarbamoyltransferase complex dimerization subunit type 1 TsaB n=1 Tax=Camelimonas abortus TaxID=1017184 RepID=A0ABV7LCP1_9HYPH